MVALALFRSYRRFVLVLYQFFPLILGYARDRHRFILIGPGRRVSTDRRRRRAQRLLNALLTLGPTFIKLGQLLSARPDVLPPEYIDVLSQLQDRVPPAPWPGAKRVIEDELGPVGDHFDDFDTEAISGASLGQVYRASVDGEPVAVKVRRPGVEDLVEADLRVIRWLLPVLIYFVDETRAFSLRNLADEFAETIRQEMDYEREAAMLEEIRANFEGAEKIRIPRLMHSHSTRRVMTMEYVDGVKITDIEEIDAMGVDRSELAYNLEWFYFQMIVGDGVFHADPHPGNLAVKPDGTIVFYDFGMSGRVDPYLQERIIEFYIAIANRDIDGILDALTAMGTLSPEADRDTMGQIMELAIQDFRGEEIETYRVQQIVQQVEDTIYEFPFRLPRNLALVLRVATVVEGVCVTLDPDFDFVAVATDYLAEQGYREESIREFVDQTRDQVKDAALASLRIPPTLERTLNRADRGNLQVKADIRDSQNLYETLAHRIVLGLFLAASTLATAYLYPVDLRAAAVAGLLGIATIGLLYRSFREPRGFRTQPQFTRQALRERRRED